MLIPRTMMENTRLTTTMVDELCGPGEDSSVFEMVHDGKYSSEDPLMHDGEYSSVNSLVTVQILT